MSGRPGAATTRQRIISAVLRIIGEDGVAGVTNRRIAREAAVSLGSITYHFATQHDLLRESLLYFVAEETRRFTEIADQACLDSLDVSSAAALVERVAASTVYDQEHIAPFELYIQAGRDPRLRVAAAECFAAYDRLAASILEALGVPGAERTAGTVVSLIMGQSLRRLATGAAGDDLARMLLTLSEGTRGPARDHEGNGRDAQVTGGESAARAE
jgi:TetR/AcrR family transcriptional regulator, regulator of biofilm formation and stress response